jgi:hypothetical protein
MTEHSVDLEKRLLAAALYELRVLLSSHVDPDDTSPEGVAAWFAYTLHNQALSALDRRNRTPTFLHGSPGKSIAKNSIIPHHHRRSGQRRWSEEKRRPRKTGTPTFLHNILDNSIIPYLRRPF